jgi:23S rRNA (guanosine2251-2'-O)-methyltransferase
MPSEMICGVNAVLEVLRAGKRRTYEIFVAKGKKKGTLERVAEEAKRLDVPVRETTRQHIQEISRVEKNQGVAARVDPFTYDSLESAVNKAKAKPSHGFVVILDEIIDPQNVGSLIRSSHVSGASALVLTKDRCAAVGPAATRAAAGATEYLPIVQVTNLANTLDWLKDEGFWIVGAEGSATQALYDYDFGDHPHAIVLGGEGKGMRRLVREKCDTLLSIPMEGEVGSYNVSVAGAVFMSEVSRQRWATSHAKIIPFSRKKVDKGGSVS